MLDSRGSTSAQAGVGIAAADDQLTSISAAWGQTRTAAGHRPVPRRDVVPLGTRSGLRFGASAIFLAAALGVPAIAEAQATVAGQSTNAPAPTPGDATPVIGSQDVAVTQDAGGGEQPEDIIVTGTSIRGVAPVGANLVSVGREAIEDIAAVNVQQILRTVPSITGRSRRGPERGQFLLCAYHPQSGFFRVQLYAHPYRRASPAARRLEPCARRSLDGADDRDPAG